MKWTTSWARAASNIAVQEWQLLGRGLADVDARVAQTRGRNERLGGIDARDRCRPEASDEFTRERAGTAADVKDPGAGRHVGEIGQQWCERPGPSPHELVVRVGGDVETHLRMLRGRRNP